MARRDADLHRPISAIGYIGDSAQHRLDELLVMRRALEFTVESERRR